MKTNTTILPACGIAGTILTIGISAILAQDSYQPADPQSGSGQQQQEQQQEWRVQQRPIQQERWRQQQRQPQQQAQQQYTRLIAAIYGLPENKDIRGTVQFDRESQGARVVAQIGGLKPKQTYSIRIHQFGDLGLMDAERVGETFDPGMDTQQQTIGIQQPRGQQANGMQQPPQAEQAQWQQGPQAQRPLGDLGTVKADNNGNIRVERSVAQLQLISGELGILGRSVVIHRADDGKRQNPVAAGVIGISQDGLPGGQTRTVGQTDRDDTYDD